ncbi:J domain-containing protein [Synechocystis sp. PCC 7509]|uniref:J domain-containing protein n=1 Tax=Synechocystis sp. PCC 7509 TaxID=927677 RepID=UPI0002AD0CA9|nr:J domain-containing protein [Synechocystis sp. PCC 7509]
MLLAFRLNPKGYSIFNFMDIAACYRLLELSPLATLAEIKASYRRLARQYHPDINPGDHIAAKEKFIALAAAYQVLVASTQQSPPIEIAPTKPKIKVTRPTSPPLSVAEQKLKNDYYQQLQELWKYQKFPRAIALAEGLARRLPYDKEIKSWSAISYWRWGSYLIGQKQPDKARIFLKKALKTDPQNRQLWSQVEQEFRRLEKIW